MSRLSKASKKPSVSNKRVVLEHKKEAVTNFMEGTSYTINPLDTLRIVAASSIFGEKSYYRDSEEEKSVIKNIAFLRGTILPDMYKEASTTVKVFKKAIKDSLDFDFHGTLKLALELRTKYNMRLNPAVIIIEAAMHPFRKAYANLDGLTFRYYAEAVVLRPDDITNQFDYFMYKNESKKGLPSIIKRAWANKLAGFSKYQVGKYKSKSLIDLVRISHAHSEILDELMKTGTIKVEDDESTWERLRSAKKSWKEILSTIKVPHMALLRNLRGIEEDLPKGREGTELLKSVSEQLIKGVQGGKQYPFRYWTALQHVDSDSFKDALNDCIEEAVKNFPILKGKTICLSDNSGSATGTTTTEYGEVCVSQIDNLSSIITAMNSAEGYVGVFGDKLTIFSTDAKSVMTNMKEAEKVAGSIGGSTENGIWIFFRDALKHKDKYDNIFIYSDMQAGHGGLYGTNPSEYSKYSWKENGHYFSSRNIDVLALVENYRQTVNPKVNVFSVQTAGYNNSVLPENYYRTAILTGWTGKEVLYATELISIWDTIESRGNQQ
jgi:hypothetical protein